MHKIFYTFCFVIGLFVQILFGQVPPDYYNSVEGLSGFSLKTGLHNIIKNHQSRSYSQLWSDFQLTDKKPNGKVWDIYSDIPSGTPPYEYTFVVNQCGNYNSEADCYNREHSFPASWFNDGSPMFTDLFHIYPTDGWVNNKRSNFPFGTVSNPTWTSLNGSKLGNCSFPGYSGVVFEPINEYKGDLARTYFYMATRYENLISSWVSNSPEAANFLDGTSSTVYKPWAINLLVYWHNSDPVSQKEINRNAAIYLLQNNRNPFIDHPEWVQKIWGGSGVVFANSINVTSEDNSELINIHQGTLQMFSQVLPLNVTNPNVIWEVQNINGEANISHTGNLSAISNGTVRVVATAADGSGVYGFKDIQISGQQTYISKNKLINKVEFIYDISQTIILIINESTNNGVFTIFSNTGAKILKSNAFVGNNKIDVSHLAKGIYILHVIINNEVYLYKFIR